MDAIQAFASSLQDPATLARWRDQVVDHLEQLPRLLGQDAGQGQELVGRVQGEFNFQFQVRLEGGGNFETGVLVAHAERTPGGLALPLRCVWKRRVGDVLVEIPGVNSNTYQICADDVGTTVVVEAQPSELEGGCFGLAVGEVGPFELDAATRRSLDNHLGGGEARFEAGLCESDFGGRRHVRSNSRRLSQQLANLSNTADQQDLLKVALHQVRITVSEDEIRVSNMPDRGGRDLVAETNAEQPKVVLHPLDPLKFTLQLNEETKLGLCANSRGARDLIALTIRCFHARKHISLAGILKEVLPVQQMQVGSGTVTLEHTDDRLECCIMQERLLKEINRAITQRDVAERMLRNTRLEKQDLEEQLQDTLLGFTEVMGELETQLGDPELPPPSQRGASPEHLREQILEVAEAIVRAEAETRAVCEELARLRVENQNRVRDRRGSGLPLAEEVQRLREERSALQTRLMELGSLSAPQDVTDEAARLQELKRLRQDLDREHTRKEQLRHELATKSREKEDLQQNFLYVKGQLDKVQVKQAQAQTSDSGQEQQRHQRALDAVGEERNRLSVRMDTLLNELEKEKAYHEQSMDRLMKANGKLMEEKDRAVREVQRIGQLYADSVKQLQEVGAGADTDRTLNTTGDLAQASESAAAEEQEEVLRLRARIEDVESELAKRALENDSLKTRIRKLATA